MIPDLVLLLKKEIIAKFAAELIKKIPAIQRAKFYIFSNN